MGATTFMTVAEGKTAQEAFFNANRAASLEFGYDGYTGTIAEKSTFVIITPKPGEKPTACANRLLDANDPRIYDKWGPAGCISMGNGKFFFFGWASA